MIRLLQPPWRPLLTIKLASTIANNTERFGGSAALSLHNATEVALELQCAIKDLAMFSVFCALLKDYQQSGSLSACIC